MASDESRPNTQPTKELSYFQKVILQDKYIQQLNVWLDNRDWELEKAQTIIAQQKKEIEAWKSDFSRYQERHKQEIKKKQDRIEQMGKKYTQAYNAAFITKNDRKKILKAAYIELRQNNELRKIRQALSEAVAIAQLLYQELENHGIKTKIKI